MKRGENEKEEVHEKALPTGMQRKAERIRFIIRSEIETIVPSQSEIILQTTLPNYGDIQYIL
jgi:hypothetical protein